MKEKIYLKIDQYHLAKGLDIVRSFSPEYQYLSPTQLIKDIFYDYIAKFSYKKSFDPTTSSLNIISTYVPATTMLPKRLDEVKQVRKIKKEPVPNKPMLAETDPLTYLNEKLHNQNGLSKAKKSSVEDFSPPEDWLD